MKKIYGFTLAEVLITLGIIGVVAALTMPSLIANYKKQAYVAQLKKCVSVVDNGFKKVLADDGVDKLSDTGLWNTFSANFGNGQQNPEFTAYLKKYFNIIDTTNTELKNYKILNGTYVTTGNNRTTFILADGAYLMFMDIYKNPAGLSTEACDAAKELGGNVCEIVSSAVYIDVNGEKLPNQFGRDTFQFILSNDGRLLPGMGKDHALYSSQTELTSNSKYWRTTNECSKNKNGFSCAARIIENGWTMDY